LETFIERDGIPGVRIPEFWENGKAFFQDSIDRGSGHEGAGIEPCLSYLLVEELDVAVTWNNVIRAFHGSKRLVPARVDELDS
jgi:hypothetical protein